MRGRTILIFVYRVVVWECGGCVFFFLFSGRSSWRSSWRVGDVGAWVGAWGEVKLRFRDRTWLLFRDRTAEVVVAGEESGHGTQDYR